MITLRIKEADDMIIAATDMFTFTFPRNKQLSFLRNVDELLGDDLDTVFTQAYDRSIQDVEVEVQCNDKYYPWPWNLAHYCFAHDRLTEEEFASLIIKPQL